MAASIYKLNLPIPIYNICRVVLDDDNKEIVNYKDLHKAIQATIYPTGKILVVIGADHRQINFFTTKKVSVLIADLMFKISTQSEFFEEQSTYGTLFSNHGKLSSVTLNRCLTITSWSFIFAY